MNQEDIVKVVKRWIEEVIIEFDFCPFAKKEFINNTIGYQVCNNQDLQSRLTFVEKMFNQLDRDTNIETMIIIYPEGLESFFDYLEFVEMANELICELGYEGVYQVASFHPDYCFAHVKQNDASNYTNRSPYPIIHVLRESSLSRVLNHIIQPEMIPEKNIKFTREKGAKYFLDRLNYVKRL